MSGKRFWLGDAARLVAAAAFLGCGIGPFGSDAGVAGDGTLASKLESIRDNHDLPSLAASLMYQGEPLESAATGLRAVGFSEEVTTADLWRIGSLTKAMTATLAAALVERGDLAWSTTVGSVFPDLPLASIMTSWTTSLTSTRRRTL